MFLFQQRHKPAAVVVAAVFFLLLSGLPSHARKIVLMPMADISKGGNGIDFAFTKAVETALKQLGVELVPRSDVMLFMARHKVRTYHYLDNYMVKKLGAEFDSSMVLVGTITEQETRDPTVGITFTALDPTDGNPIWSASAATSAQEQVRIFGLGEARTPVELARPLLSEMLAPLVKLAVDTEVSESRDFQLLGMYLFPAYVQGGQAVAANLKIRFLGKRPTLIAAESAAGINYLQYDRRTDSYQGKWYAPTADGSYKVDLRIEWGREQTVQKVRNVATFDVINKAPGLLMEIKKGIQVGSRLAVRDHILILPRVGDTRPMSGWALEITGADGGDLVYEEYEGDIPERMVWEGRSSDGFKLANGTYVITLHVWDLAGNQSSNSRTVVLQSSAPQVKADIANLEGMASLTLSPEGLFEFPITSWTAELQTLGGELLFRETGEQLPVTLDFKVADGEQYVVLSITGKDLLGNRLRVKRQKIPIVEVEQEIKEQKAESWVPDF